MHESVGAHCISNSRRSTSAPLLSSCKTRDAPLVDVRSPVWPHVGPDMIAACADHARAKAAGLRCHPACDPAFMTP